METYISLRMDSSYIRSIVRTRRRWLSKYTLSDKVSCIFTLVLFMVICISREVDCSRLNGAFASPCYRLDGQNKPILDKPQVRRYLLERRCAGCMLSSTLFENVKVLFYCRNRKLCMINSSAKIIHRLKRNVSIVFVCCTLN